eukprot:8839133-Ditylum_brightwellii.AAC.1
MEVKQAKQVNTPLGMALKMAVLDILQGLFWLTVWNKLIVLLSSSTMSSDTGWLGGFYNSVVNSKKVPLTSLLT